MGNLPIKPNAVDTNSSLDKKTPLTRGLFRNTIFNIFGWIWPVGLAFFTVPYILRGLGTEAYGVFGLVSITAGYLGLLNSPMAFGNIRFMAEAYGRQDWIEFYKYVFAGLWVSLVLTGAGALVMILASGILARQVFKIPNELILDATRVFRLAAVSFFFNGITSVLQGIPSAQRKYGVLNIISVVVGTLNTIGIVVAIWLKWGLFGAVVAQLLSSLFAVFVFGILAFKLLSNSNSADIHIGPDWPTIKNLLKYSSYLFVSQVMSTIGLQLDKTLVGILFGASSVTFYTIPSKIIDQIPGLTGRFTIALYPLSAESNATGRLQELKELYVRMIRSILLLSSFIVTLIVAFSHYILALWVGNDIANKSSLLLSILALSTIWRGTGSVCYQ
ncbi:MAG: oligosaccharide flippase family protein, partial [Bacteroidetes bacterium]|nr:oligosaccharide flippase family protein [Bacteroidota bacterium]